MNDISDVCQFIIPDLYPETIKLITNNNKKIFAELNY